MNPIFLVLFVLGFGWWMAVDYSKVKDSGRSRLLFFLIHAVTAFLFIALLMDYKPSTPVTWLNEILYPWAKAWTGEISYVKTGH